MYFPKVKLLDTGKSFYSQIKKVLKELIRQNNYYSVLNILMIVRITMQNYISRGIKIIRS